MRSKYQNIHKIIREYRQYDDKSLILEWYYLNHQIKNYEEEKSALLHISTPLMNTAIILLITILIIPIEKLFPFMEKLYENYLKIINIAPRKFAEEWGNMFLEMTTHIIIVGLYIFILIVIFNLFMRLILKRKRKEYCQIKLRFLVVEQLLKERGLLTKDVLSNL